MTLKPFDLPNSIRYGLVGLITNLFTYLVYVLTTYFWINPKLALTIFYPLGAIIAYLGHKKYSFTYRGKNTGAIIRYIFAYFLGYGLNLTMLFVLSDKFNFPHQAVQALAIPLVAGVLFLMLKYFVFSPSTIRGKA